MSAHSPDQRVTEVAIAVVENKGCVLIGRRAEEPLAGYWEFPGGKVLSGETPRAAAARECLEETGVSITVRELDCEVEHAYPHGRVRLHFFHCRLCVPQYAPRGGFRWIPVSKLADYEFPEANRTIIDRLVSHG